MEIDFLRTLKDGRIDRDLLTSLEMSLSDRIVELKKKQSSLSNERGRIVRETLLKLEVVLCICMYMYVCVCMYVCICIMYVCMCVC
jgi:hypothetical protein